MDIGIRHAQPQAVGCGEGGRQSTLLRRQRTAYLYCWCDRKWQVGTDAEHHIIDCVHEYTRTAQILLIDRSWLTFCFDGQAAPERRHH